MHIKQVQLKQFRCFQDDVFHFDNKVVLITGTNGSGKSSLLEALHYGCYLKSFRTHLPRELVSFDRDTFFIKLDIATQEYDQIDSHAIQIGFSGKKRLVKIDQKAIQSFRELTSYYRVVTLTEEDLTIIKGGPEVRRSFMDQALTIHDPNYVHKLRAYKQILENRNALLQQRSYNKEVYELWTNQLWQHSVQLQKYRRTLLATLEQRTNKLLRTWFDTSLTIRFSYRSKKIKEGQSFEEFMREQHNLPEMEGRFGRSLFGLHLDDFLVEFCEKASKAYASRGQQKLTILLLKVAQIQEIMAQTGQVVFLLDDFMADFDEKKGAILIRLLYDLTSQLIFTSPTVHGHFERCLLDQGAQRIKLTH